MGFRSLKPQAPPFHAWPFNERETGRLVASSDIYLRDHRPFRFANVFSNIVGGKWDIPRSCGYRTIGQTRN